MKCIWEHNGHDTLLHAVDYAGAYARGESLETAAAKMPEEIMSYCAWSMQPFPDNARIEIVQDHPSSLQIADADSDILFDAEKAPLSREAYESLKALALKSAADFHSLYASIPEKGESCLTPRRTFYGNVPRTAHEMYEHTKSVNDYYFAEIGVDADHENSILDCRIRGFSLLEQKNGFLDDPVVEGSYGELWSLRKVMRRFIWHDRIHAKAMYRMAVRTFGMQGVENPFKFKL